MTAEQTWGSDSPHAEAVRAVLASDARRIGGEILPCERARLEAKLAIADEIAELRRQQHGDAIDLANAVATLTGAIAQPERVYMAVHMTWWGHLRALFGGAR